MNHLEPDLPLDDDLRSMLISDMDMMSQLDCVYLVVCQESGVNCVYDGVFTDEALAHTCAAELSSTDIHARYWVQKVVLTGPALETKDTRNDPDKA